MSNRLQTTITYELHSHHEDGQWRYYSSDWDFQTDEGPLPTSQELADMLEDWLREVGETEGTWSLTAYLDGDEDSISGVVEL